MQNLSRHAALRTQQRRVPAEHIELALDWGRPIHQRNGRVAYHLGSREVAEALNRGVHIPEAALGVAVVLAEDGTAVTVVRSQDRSRLVRLAREQRRRGAGGTP